MNVRWLAGKLAIAVAVLACVQVATAQATKTPAELEIDREVDAALTSLRMSAAGAKPVAEKAKAVLVFPGIVKGGMLVGGQYGKGALRKGNTTAAYYQTVSASYGLQLGVQKYGYALFFMNDGALAYLDHSDGWEVGVGPSLVIVDTAMARSLSTTTLNHDIYAFVFDQSGLMAGLGLQGSKITKINP